MEAGKQGGIAPTQEPKAFVIETTETLHRAYRVKAGDREMAIRRLRLYWSDPEALAEGVVSGVEKEEVSSRQVRDVKK
jgi:hypothetical protein